MAEAYALSNAVEHGLRTRAAIVDMKGQLNIRQWEETASTAMGHVCFFDNACETVSVSQLVDARKQMHLT